MNTARTIAPTLGVWSAYNKISKRTGKMVNGMFVKEES